MIDLKREIRETSQIELPVKDKDEREGYNIYPSFNIGDSTINCGYDSLAKSLVGIPVLKIDGYVGVIFEAVKHQLDEAFSNLDIQAQWINVENALKEEKEIDTLVAPFLGGDDPVFGKLSTLDLIDFFDPSKLEALSKTTGKNPIIFYGTGAALVPVEGVNLFVEVSKNEIQYRSRAGAVLNLGASKSFHPKKMYKRFYFVDWAVLNKHKNALKDRIDFMIDGQRSIEITWMTGDNWRKGIQEYVKNPIRVRPWFEPGAWGGHWIEKHIKGLSEDVINYAWSFELIVPENGVIFESSGYLLEFSFDFLMYHAGSKILGDDFETYQYEFPIRFDFLDTFDGGNLSIQCHPQKQYMKEHFGENITQEETYYILDRKNNAQVYLGFQEGVTPSGFQHALEESVRLNKELDILKYVQAFDAKKHGLYLIPPGTIHGSGTDNLVLEISSTPYIYTFKMYDWLRLDLDGKPRPINIERGMDNLVFERSGESVAKELIASPEILEENKNYTLEHLATHSEHLYDVHRYTINTKVNIDTENKTHILSLVEGQKMLIKTSEKSFLFSYAESFIMPAIVGNYTIENLTDMPIKLIKAFIK